MDVQTIRRHNLGHILSVFELAGISYPCEQAHVLADIVTPHKLVRLLLASHIDALIARGVEYATGLPRGWMDQPHARAPSVVRCGAGYRLDPTVPPSPCASDDPVGIQPVEPDAQSSASGRLSPPLAASAFAR